jgi:hypothetical protein
MVDHKHELIERVMPGFDPGQPDQTYSQVRDTARGAASMTHAEVTAALASRLTMRVTYHRRRDMFTVAISLGDAPVNAPLWLASETDAEQWAEFFAHLHNLDITHLDVD